MQFNFLKKNELPKNHAQLVAEAKQDIETRQIGNRAFRRKMKFAKTKKFNREKSYRLGY